MVGLFVRDPASHALLARMHPRRTWAASGNDAIFKAGAIVSGESLV